VFSMTSVRSAARCWYTLVNRRLLCLIKHNKMSTYVVDVGLYIILRSTLYASVW